MPDLNPINLISTYAALSKVSGPGKVFHNLIKGLEAIRQPYVINRRLTSTRRLWIHSDLRALLELPRKGSTINLLGPNLAVLPRNLPTNRPFPDSLFLSPSQWIADLWQQEGFNQCPLRAWPVGINTDQFPERPEGKLTHPILVYFKQRSPHELEQVESTLKRLRLNYHLLVYGAYDERDFMARLRDCSFVIWLGCHESQGIALQQTLATNTPILVLDALSLFDECPAPAGLFPPRLRSFRTTSAPYFDSRCGIILTSINDLGMGIQQMHEQFESFRPREFILENLSMEKQAREFVGFFEELSLPDPAVRQADTDDQPYIPRLTTRIRLKRIVETQKHTRYRYGTSAH